jgi:UDP-N-acetylglucosamine 4,6-dehydratase/5-epimerase
MNILQDSAVFVTGGAGTLGRAIAKRRKNEGWTGKLTVYSTDNHKHQFMRGLYPDVNFVQGDIRNLETLKLAMVGHDVVIHGAAVKVIPDSEWWSLDTIDVNVYGSQNVLMAAQTTGVAHVLGISTDKACHAANAYGATKYLMEKMFQEYARAGGDAQAHLVRYGNVLESTGSVIEAWKKAVAAGQTVRITDGTMTRFWLSPAQAVDLVIEALHCESGDIYVPKAPALSIEKLLEYTIGWEKCTTETVPLRPGEKLHETLVTEEEWDFTDIETDYHIIHPTTTQRKPLYSIKPYTSLNAVELTEAELQELLNDDR